MSLSCHISADDNKFILMLGFVTDDFICCVSSAPKNKETLFHLVMKLGLVKLSEFLAAQPQPGGSSALALPNEDGATPLDLLKSSQSEYNGLLLPLRKESVKGCGEYCCSSQTICLFCVDFCCFLPLVPFCVINLYLQLKEVYNLHLPLHLQVN